MKGILVQTHPCSCEAPSARFYIEVQIDHPTNLRTFLFHELLYEEHPVGPLNELVALGHQHLATHHVAVEDDHQPRAEPQRIDLAVL